MSYLRIAPTSDPDIVLIISDERQRMMCKIQRTSDGNIHISDWIKANPNEYNLKFIEKEAIIYTINNLKCAVLNESKNDRQYAISWRCGSVYCYDFCTTQPTSSYEDFPAFTVQIPQPPGQTNLLFPTNIFQDYILKWQGM